MFSKKSAKIKKTATIIGLVVLATVVLVKSGTLDALVVFLLAGQIPGTNYAIPSTLMLLGIVCILWLLIFRFTAIELVNSASTKRSAKKHVQQRKKRMPKRRFNQI